MMKALLVLVLTLMVLVAPGTSLSDQVPDTPQRMSCPDLAAVQGGELTFACGFTIGIAVAGLATGNYFLAMHGMYAAYYYCN